MPENIVNNVVNHTNKNLRNSSETPLFEQPAKDYIPGFKNNRNQFAKYLLENDRIKKQSINVGNNKITQVVNDRFSLFDK